MLAGALNDIYRCCSCHLGKYPQLISLSLAWKYKIMIIITWNVVFGKEIKYFDEGVCFFLVL